MRPITRDETAAARVERLTPREREVLLHLVDGQTNKMIGQKLGISPRTVELHRAQVMNRLNASNLTELLQVALGAGVAPCRPRAAETANRVGLNSVPAARFPSPFKDPC
jgi:DNA-binding NarL/FixJ family response regulator